MKRQLYLATLLIICCVPGFVLAEELREIEFASEAWEGVTNEDGTGLCWDLFWMVYEPEGIAIKFRILPYARTVHLVQSKQVDATVGVYFEEFEDALFSQWHYLQDRVLVIFN